MSLLQEMIEQNKNQLYIGGEWRAGSSGATFPVHDPATEEVLAEVADATPEDGLDAAGAATSAAPEWEQTSPRERSDILRRAFDLLHERKEPLAELITLENGKTLNDSRGEVVYGAEFFRWFSEEAVRNYGQTYRSPSGDKRIFVIHQPVGLSLLVTPWNFPISMGTRKIGPALAAGCTVILKPAKETPLIALALADILEEAGCPPGVVNVVPTSKASSVVGPLIQDPRVRKLSFTGSTEVGRVLLKQAADQVLKVSMELGGNAPFLVFADSDLDAAVEGAMLAKMRNAGEACTAANRFYVEAPIAMEFSDRLTAAMEALTVGSGLEPDVDVGPLVNRDTQEKVAELVTAAVDGNARVLTGGSVPNRAGFFYAPTVLADVQRDAEILNTEIFGPVAPIVPFTGMEEAIDMANDTELGLISYVYSGDERKAFGVAEGLEAGMVAVNRGLVSDPAAPFGGVKQSGLGREGAHDGMMEYLETKYIGTAW